MSHNLPTVQSLRKEGFKVRVSHYRYTSPEDVHYGVPTRVTKVDKKARKYEFIHEKGGRTEVEVTDVDGNTFKSQAKCSDKDQFNRKMGIRICLNRLRTQNAI